MRSRSFALKLDKSTEELYFLYLTDIIQYWFQLKIKTCLFYILKKEQNEENNLKLTFLITCIMHLVNSVLRLSTIFLTGDHHDWTLTKIRGSYKDIFIRVHCGVYIATCLNYFFRSFCNLNNRICPHDCFSWLPSFKIPFFYQAKRNANSKAI